MENRISLPGVLVYVILEFNRVVRFFNTVIWRKNGIVDIFSDKNSYIYFEIVTVDNFLCENILYNRFILIVKCTVYSLWKTQENTHVRNTHASHIITVTT